MIEVVAFSDLDPFQRASLRIALMATTPQQYADDAAMQAVLGGAHFNDGRSTFTAWRAARPAGTLSVVTREAPRNGQIFATRVATIESDADVSHTLVEHALKLGRAAGGRRFMLGLVPEVRARWPDLEGFAPAYDALELVFPVARTVPPPSIELTLRAVTDESAEIYRNVLNASFADTPNGATESPDDIARQRAAPGARMLLGFVDEVPALAAYLLVNHGDFVIDAIGVVPSARRGGLGRALVRTLLHLAQADRVARISLTVIDSNERALNLYLSEGFERERVLTHWLGREL